MGASLNSKGKNIKIKADLRIEEIRWNNGIVRIKDINYLNEKYFIEGLKSKSLTQINNN